MKPLKESLAEWTDTDCAMYYLTLALGLVESPTPWDGKKWLFWSNNPVGNLLYEQLRQLAEIGVLQYDDEEERFRWNPEFELPA
ncbi:hypothetical protein [Blastopirellula marina]|uniref:Uncharacterized protein n=1 Tax=Blastopirellula marina TaxID=124 RepID=A0A2S8F258_9BACT|nr:hypothetical protein [Blastopirellula marina]PQO26251.1 hypothetical protein C5Y98_30870 [Blastopirellula marina]PTL40651.1 hypothetical protein C5Y97_30885 [Blastopirellula marina]